VVKDPWIGLFADEPELVDEILEEALRNWAVQPLNQKLDKVLLNTDIVSEIFRGINQGL
jgi:hypothetical protein